MSQIYTAAVTLLVLALHFALTGVVGQARARYGIKAPAVTGHERFERAYRVQMNTIEQMMFFLPSLWLCAVLLSDKAAAAGGLIWLIGRVLYALRYLKDPATRGLGVAISVLAQSALWLGAVAGLVRVMILGA